MEDRIIKLCICILAAVGLWLADYIYETRKDKKNKATYKDFLNPKE